MNALFTILIAAFVFTVQLHCQWLGNIPLYFALGYTVCDIQIRLSEDKAVPKKKPTPAQSG